MPVRILLAHLLLAIGEFHKLEMFLGIIYTCKIEHDGRRVHPHAIRAMAAKVLTVSLHESVCKKGTTFIMIHDETRFQIKRNPSDY